VISISAKCSPGVVFAISSAYLEKVFELLIPSPLENVPRLAGEKFVKIER
jgi:hypothetical protein